MLLEDNRETQLGKSLLWVRCCSFCACKPSILRNQWCTDLTHTTVLEAGIVPVLLHQASPSLAFSHSECISKHYPISILNDQKRLFFFLLKYQSHIQRLNSACSSPPHYQLSLSCNIPILPPTTCSPSEGRGRSCREELEIQETSKLQKIGENQCSTLLCSVKRNQNKLE